MNNDSQYEAMAIDSEVKVKHFETELAQSGKFVSSAEEVGCRSDGPTDACSPEAKCNELCSFYVASSTGSGKCVHCNKCSSNEGEQESLLEYYAPKRIDSPIKDAEKYTYDPVYFNDFRKKTIYNVDTSGNHIKVREEYGYRITNPYDVSGEMFLNRKYYADEDLGVSVFIPVKIEGVIIKGEDDLPRFYDRLQAIKEKENKTSPSTYATTIESVVFEDCIFSCMELQKIQFSNCIFKNCTFYKCSFLQAYFVNCTLMNVCFVNIKQLMRPIEDIKMFNCTLDYVVEKNIKGLKESTGIVEDWQFDSARRDELSAIINVENLRKNSSVSLDLLDCNQYSCTLVGVNP